MSDTAANSDKPRSLLLEFGICFCLGFGLMAAYWLLREPPAAPGDPQAAIRVIHGAPTLTAGRAASTTDSGGKAEVTSTRPLPQRQPEEAKTQASPADAKKTVVEEEPYQYLSFQTLGGYLYEPPDPDGAVGIPGLPKPKNVIPDSIKAYHGKKVHLQGFMVPIRIEKGAVKSFVLCQTLPQCCFGDSMRMNQWVIVTMAAEKSAQYIADQTVMVWGRLEVGEKMDQGIVLSLYRLEAEQVSGPPDL